MSLQEISTLLSPKTAEIVTPECWCDKPRSAQKTIEEVTAELLEEKQLKEIFRKELRKDTFKLCRDSNGKYLRDDREGRIPQKSLETQSLEKKGHFLPPLKRKPRIRKIKKYLFSGAKIEDEMEDDDYYNGKKDRNKIRSSRLKRRNISKRMSRSRLKDKKHWGTGSSMDFTGQYEDSSGEEMSTSLNISEYESYDRPIEREEYSQHSSIIANREFYLLKYFQLKKLAAKIESRAIATQTRKSQVIGVSKTGYEIGFGEGTKKAFSLPPIYEKPTLTDFVGDDDTVIINESSAFEDRGPEDSVHNICTVPQTRTKTKVIFISMDEQQVHQMKKSYKDVEIRVVENRHLASFTEEVIEKKIEDYMESYKDILADKSSSFIQNFRDGFIDGFDRTFIFNPTDSSFIEDEKLYVNEVRKCVLDDEDVDDSYVKKSLLDRAYDLKKSLKGIVDFDAYEKEIHLLDLTKPISFTKSDFMFFYVCGKKKKSLKSVGKRTVSKQHRSTYVDVSSSSSSEKTYLQHICDDIKTDAHAWNYLNKHNIGELFRYMGIMLCSCKPDDPIDFLIKLLEKCLMFRNNESHHQAPLVFTEKHVESIYCNMDPLNYGHIDSRQYLYGLHLLEITEPEDYTLVQNTDKVEKNQFLINANDRLLEKFRIMIAVC